MTIGVCSDHRGVYLKKVLIEYLEHNGYSVVNYGSDTAESVDFPEYAFKLGDAINQKEAELGIAICGTGIGMSIALNKVKGIYCAKISNISEAMLCKSHNNANVIAISADMDEEQAKSVVDKFILTPFSNVDKYVKRNQMIQDKEKNG